VLKPSNIIRPIRGLIKTILLTIVELENHS